MVCGRIIHIGPAGRLRKLAPGVAAVGDVAELLRRVSLQSQDADPPFWNVNAGLRAAISMRDDDAGASVTPGAHAIDPPFPAVLDSPMVTSYQLTLVLIHELFGEVQLMQEVPAQVDIWLALSPRSPDAHIDLPLDVGQHFVECPPGSLERLAHGAHDDYLRALFPVSERPREAGIAAERSEGSLAILRQLAVIVAIVMLCALDHVNHLIARQRKVARWLRRRGAVPVEEPAEEAGGLSNLFPYHPSEVDV